jgi:hypothetical protein
MPGYFPLSVEQRKAGCKSLQDVGSIEPLNFAEMLTREVKSYSRQQGPDFNG